MKKVLIFILFSSFFISAIYAQDQSNTNSIKKGKSDRIIINLCTDIWKNADPGMTVSPYSPGFDIYGMYDTPLGKSKFSFALGLGFGTENLRSDAMPENETKFDSTLAQYVETGKTIFERIPDYVNNKKINYDINKLTLTYLDIPLELRFRKENKKGKAFKFSIGGKLGYLVNSHTKYKGTDLTDGDGNVKYKTYNIPNIEPLRYGAMVRFGYSFFNIYGYYSFSKIFKENKGPQMYPISVGICITPF